MATRTSKPEPMEAWSETTEPELRGLVEAAETSQGRDSIGHQAVATLLSRGFPDALLIPPAALETYREANIRRRLWIPFVIHFGLVAFVVLAVCVGVTYELLREGWPEDRNQFVLIECGSPRTDLREAASSTIVGGAWIVIGALAAFAAPGSWPRRTGALLLAISCLAGVYFLFRTGTVTAVARVDGLLSAAGFALTAAWLLAPFYLLYGSLLGHG